jgi:hypothetical protein
MGACVRGAIFSGFALASLAIAQAPVQVTLSPTTSPASGEPAVTTINLTGSNFPSGTIVPANVTINLTPRAGAPLTTQATAVTTVVGTTLRVTFTIPASASRSFPTAYAVSLSGVTSANVAFAGSNTASLIVNPQATIGSVNPTGALAGQTISVAIVGAFSNWLQGSTQASFGGAGVTVNSTSVTDATHASANITIAAAATAGARTVTMTTGLEVAPLANGFAIEALVPPVAVSGNTFSILNTASPTASTPPIYSVSGPTFSILNSISPLIAPPMQTFVGPNFPAPNGSGAMFRSRIPMVNSSFIRPVDPAFVAAALARGAQRIDGKPVCVDSDGDGLCDADELIIGTNPFFADTDGDGYPDGLELALGSDPLNANSIPAILTPGHYLTSPISIRNLGPIVKLTPPRQGAIDANNKR